MQRILFTLWMTLAALIVMVTMAVGLATSSHAAEMVDPIHTSAIAAAPISKASDRIFVIALLVTGFATLAVGGIMLTVNSFREAFQRRRRN